MFVSRMPKWLNNAWDIAITDTPMIWCITPKLAGSAPNSGANAPSSNVHAPTFTAAVTKTSPPRLSHAVAQPQTVEQFLYQAEGRQIIEVEPGEYRLVQIDHPRYSVFQLASLLEKSEPLLHFNKLRKEMHPQPKPVPLPMPRRDP